MRWTLSGIVREAGAAVVVPGARVTVVDGPNGGRSAVTDAEGRYSLDTLEPGTLGLRATADGYEPESGSVALTSNLTLDFGLRRPALPPPPPPPTPKIIGTTIDAVSDRALAEVRIRIDGVGEAVTGGDGSFQFDAEEPEQVRLVTLSSSVTVDRQTQLRVPGPPATLSLIPSSLDLTAFNQMFRSGGSLIRWTSAPSIVLQTRVLQFTNVTDQEYTATEAVMSDDEIAGLAADLTWALPQLTGNTFGGFAGEQRETAAPGDRVRVSRPGQIVVARYAGLQAATTFWGYGRWMTAAGEVRAGIIMLDNGFDTSGSPFQRSLRAHELGHALGYNHVTGRESVMNASARNEPNSFDRDGAKLAFRRPPLNRSPDIDPDAFTPNLRGLAEFIWHGAR